MSKYQYDGLMAEKVAFEHPLMDEVFELYYKMYMDREYLNLFPPINVNLKQVEIVEYKHMPEDEEYWEAQKALMVKTMEESKKNTGHF